ncbi:Fc receptor-like protein 5 isoform X1 [Anguilla rostrata]|uniref:Fc receptor-like protein 5 isoform X1 n=2 Tax=Anguilla rostrata TaxID=7938 RepID=UPI0030D5A46C
MEQRQCSWPVTVLVFAAVLWMQRGSNFGPRPSHSSHRPNLWLALCGLSRGGIRACPCAGRSAAQAPVLSGPDRAYLDKRAVFHCEVPGLPRPLAYQLLKGPGDRPVAVQTQEGPPPANFTLVVRSDSGGMYHCRARTGGDPSSYPLSSNYLSFQVVIPVSGADLVSDPDPPVVWEGERLSLHCQVKMGSHLSYRWYFNRTELYPPSTPPGEPTLVITPVSQQHAGWYYCIVGNNMTNSRFSSSSDLEVRVKVFLSEPQISFSVTKEESGYRADVRCWSARGSPPVRFRLIKGNLTLANRTTESLSAVFPVPVSIGQSLGLLRCGGCNHDNRELLSRPLNLEVVPVGGAVQLHVEYLYSAGSEAVGVALRCLVSHGTFPEYAWFLNHTLLQGGGASHIITQEGHTLILPIITAGNSGSYRCQAKDSFDNTTWIPSPAAFIQKTGRRLVSSEVIAVAFCCFLLLVLVGSVCWIFTFSKKRLDSRLRRRSSAAIPATGIGDRGVA